MRHNEHVHEKFQHAGFTVKIVPDPDSDEPDWGESDFYLHAEAGGGYGSYEIGRKNVQDGDTHVPWGEFKWGAFGSDIPTEPGEAMDLYDEWLDCYDPSYQVWPIKAGNAHGPGSFTIWECAETDEIEGYVFVKVPDTDLGKIGDAGRDVEKIKDQLIEHYEQWCRGEVYGYIIEDSDGEEVESCWSYYGDERAIEEGKSMAEALATDSHTRPITLIVLRKNKTWEYLNIRVPLFVGESGVVEWATKELVLGSDESVQEYIVAKEQLPLFEVAS